MFEVTINHYITLCAIVFFLGLFGLISNRKNIILVFMSIELMLLAINIQLVAFSAFLGDLAGQILTMFILTVAAAEVAIGLAILVSFYRQKNSIALSDVNQLKG